MTLEVKMQIRSSRGHHWLRPPPMPFFASAEIDSCGGYRDLPRSQELKSHRPSNSLNQNAAKFLPTWKTWMYCKTYGTEGQFSVASVSLHFNESLRIQYWIVHSELYFVFRLFLKQISIQHSNDWPSNWACLCSHTFCILPPVGSQEHAVTCTLYHLRWKF